MLARSEAKTLLYLLLVLTILALLALIAAIVLSLLWKQVGFMMETGTASLCTPYLTLKTQTLTTFLHNNIFACACVATALTAALLALVLYLVVTFRRSEEEDFPQFSRHTFYLLYILYSSAIVFTVPGSGYYLTFIFQKGGCLGSIQLEWVIIGALYLLALLLLLICWVFLFILFIKSEEHEEKVDKKIAIISNEEPQISMKNYLEMFLLKQRMENMSTILESRRPLLVQEVEEDDRASLQQGQKQKITFVNFEEYKEKQKLLRQKEEQQQKKLAIMMKEQQERMMELRRKENEQRSKNQEHKQKISSMALSPNHQDFDKIFEESQEDEPVNEITLNIDGQNIQKSQNITNKSNDNYDSSEDNDIKMKDFYPANYVPVDEEDERGFRKYKDNLLKRLNRTKASIDPKRHLQNIEGGRSKKMLQKYINAVKRPKRNEEMYKRIIMEETPSQIEASVIPDSELTDNLSHKQSVTFNNNSPIQQQPEHQQNLTIEINPSPDNQPYDQEERQYQVITIKERTKSPMKKKLFEEQTNYLQSMNSGSILGNLVKRVIEPEHKRRLHKIKEQRQIDQKMPKKRKNEKLIDYIRAKGT